MFNCLYKLFRCHIITDYRLISEGQKCSTVDSHDSSVGKVSGNPIGGCAQYCRSVANKFSIDDVKNCNCHLGTRQSGRCVLTEAQDVDLYEIVYPGS